ncbi:vacuolar protein sorting-associated protein 52 homolog [Mytilus californianus]|uniref:vacuolar protein sorting-associated protein 52 homolog n=1 Tax=Mytilus californianus TaxID=6549 RepID=UPI0022459E24|nr:vacuolar protein sorting-associated protein 52 homolog [Mytilus californianus]XP_052091208.1 vacuolar protein sorting-associated protein 52 homolog [Mytilus californianus]XP_052091209.1 vacuolar protein sorting-associated protein 52 homolog [Mytilus californianus]XP_052091210.1 vacuolar protein sorting-associated protein 52 homolog [Mytilus californianus]
MDPHETMDLNLGELDITSEDYWLDEVDVHIQQNLEDEIVKEALKTGVDLRQYSKTVEKELLGVENESIKDYLEKGEDIASLHKQISACDTILERMEQMLNGFQGDLSSISTEIQTLQEQSVTMNVKLKNRQAVRGELSQFVDEMVIPETMINHILDTPVTEREFLEQLHELHHKINFVKEQSFKEARSCFDVKDILEKLKIKAISKIREYILQKINSFKKPMSNYQVPQNAMLKFRFFNEFLMSHERHVAREIRDEYVDTMSKIYLSYFKGYLSRLMKLQFEESADKEDLMGAEDSAKKGFFSSKPTLKNRSTVFTLGSRGNVLTTDLEGPIIVPHASQKQETKHNFESLFRSLHYAVMDNCCREYLFLVDFFMVTGPSATDLFNAIMSKTVSLFLSKMEEYTADCFDSIAIFLCIHVVYRYKSMMNKRGVPAIDRYWDALVQVMWPRFQLILEMNTQSIRAVDPSKLGHIDVRPHYITRRYAEFSAAIVGINQSFPDERVYHLLSQLQTEVENFILKIAAEFPHRKEQLICLINNYDMLLGVLMERTTEDSKETESFKELLTARTGEFIEEILSPYFGGMIMFVKDCELQMDRGGAESIKCDEKRVQQIVRGFNNDWKRALEMINGEVMRAFTNFKNGTQILQGALTQLIQYYHRFQKVLSQGAFRNMQIRNELINIHHVMVEVKKYKPTF